MLRQAAQYQARGGANACAFPALVMNAVPDQPAGQRSQQCARHRVIGPRVAVIVRVRGVRCVSRGGPVTIRGPIRGIATVVERDGRAVAPVVIRIEMVASGLGAERGAGDKSVSYTHL